MLVECSTVRTIRTMRHYWPDPEVAPDAPELIENRQTLVAEFNEIVGLPGREVQESQAAFIAGSVSYDEAVSYVRYAKYMIANCSGLSGK